MTATRLNSWVESRWRRMWTDHYVVAERTDFLVRGVMRAFRTMKSIHVGRHVRRRVLFPRPRFWWASFGWQAKNLVLGNRKEWACTLRSTSSDEVFKPRKARRRRTTPRTRKSMRVATALSNSWLISVVSRLPSFCVNITVLSEPSGLHDSITFLSSSAQNSRAAMLKSMVSAVGRTNPLLIRSFGAFCWRSLAPLVGRVTMAGSA